MIKSTFEEHVLMSRLPSSPEVGSTLLQLLRRQALPPQEIAVVVRGDPAMTGRLLQAANVPATSPATSPLTSPATSNGEPILTVEAAIGTLASRELLRAVRDLTLVGSEDVRRCAGFDYDRYWATSRACASAAETVVKATGRGSASAAYTLGLLADVGRLALASVYPTEYAALLADWASGGTSELARLERERLHIDHAEVAACLLENWGLPRVFSRAVCLSQRDADGDETEEADAIAWAEALACAHALAEHHVRTHEGALPESEPVLARLSETLHITPKAAGELYAQALAAMSAPSKPAALLGTTATDEGRAAAALSSDPVAPSAVDGARATDALPNAAARKPKGLRVLAVDDDPMSLQLLRRVLEQAGHEVVCASDGVDALRLALATNVQAVVADWMMPGMDGVELCKSLRCIQSGREMFYLLLTGRDQEDHILEAYVAGVDEYVTKPFNGRILLARLRAGQRVIELKEEIDAERLITAQQVGELGLLNRRLRATALTDPLTGLPNRRCAYDRLAEEWQLSSRSRAPMAAMMVDIDGFKKVNDQHGHEIGDLVLKEVAGVLRAHVRRGEELARLGGEEFVVVCPNSTADQAKVGAERLRAAVQVHVISAGNFNASVTVSLGVAERTSAMSGVDGLLRAADDAVYAAKNAGKNQVWVFGAVNGTVHAA